MIFVNGYRKRGHGGVVSSYSTSMSLPRVEGLSADPRFLRRHMNKPNFGEYLLILVSHSTCLAG